MYIDTLASFFQKHKRIFFSAVFFIGLFFILGDGVFATTTTSTGDGNILDKKTAEKVTKILNYLLAAASVILGLATSLVSMFLYPGWVNGTLFGLQDYFKDIWILISNIVYFIFAGVLIVIAFMNIIGKGEGTWELKQALPKFIVGVLIVPFSWFFVQFILSITAILTIGVLTLPYDTFKDRPELDNLLSSDIASQQICTDLIIDMTGKGGRGASLSSVVNNVNSKTQIEFPDQMRCDTSADNGGIATIKEVLEGTRGGEGLKSSIFGITNIYTYGVLRIQNLNEIGEKDIAGGIKEIADLIFKIIFDLLFVIVYLLLMVALFLALFVRVVRLWIYMMLSPAFGLLYFFGKSSEGIGSDNAKFSIKEFIALALVPVYVSAALAFGLVFILVAGSGIENESNQDGKLDMGGFSLTIVGALGDSGSEKSVLGKLIVQIFGIVILWIAVMSALRSSETTKAVVEPIAAFGKSVGQLAAKAPTYAPIIPTGVGDDGKMNRISATGLASAGSRIEQSFRGEAQSRGSDFADRVLPNQGGPTAGIQDLFTRSGVREDSIMQEKFKVIDNALKTYGSDILKDQRVRQKFEDEIGKVGIKAEITNLKDQTLISKELFRAMDTEAGMINNNVTSADVFQKTYFGQSVVDKSKGKGEAEKTDKKDSSTDSSASRKVEKIDTTVRVEVTDAIFKDFKDNDKVTDDVLLSIANKVHSRKVLTDNERNIRIGREDNIKELLEKIDEQTD